MKTPKNESQTLNCSTCNGALELPSDETAVSMICPYCEKENLIPKHILSERAKQAKAVREAEEKNRIAAQSTVRQKQTTIRVAISAGIGLIGMCAIAGFIWYIHDSTTDKRPKDSNTTGLNAANQWMTEQKEAGCSYVVTSPTLHSGHFGWEAKLQKRGDCVKVLSAVNDRSTSLKMEMQTPEMDVIQSEKINTNQVITHCGKTDGTYPVSVIPSSNNWYTFTAVACPRSMFEEPIPTDTKSTGAEAVANRMKTLYEQGCKSIVHTAKQAQGDINWTPDFPKSKRGDCLNILAMTGIEDNQLTIQIKNPFGENLPMPKSSNIIDYMICSDAGGPHPITVTATKDTPYTFAAVGCPRRIAKKITPNAEAPMTK